MATDAMPNSSWQSARVLVLVGCLVTLPIVAVRDSLASWMAPPPPAESSEPSCDDPRLNAPAQPSQLLAVRRVDAMLGPPPPSPQFLGGSRGADAESTPWTHNERFVPSSEFIEAPPAERFIPASMPDEIPNTTAEIAGQVPPADGLAASDQVAAGSQVSSGGQFPASEPLPTMDRVASAPDTADVPDVRRPRIPEVMPVSNHAVATRGPRLPLTRDEIERMETIRERLQDYGATFGRLERWGDEGTFRFQCRIPLSHDPEESRHFESVGDSPLALMEDVLRQVINCRDTPPQMAQRLPPLAP